MKSVRNEENYRALSVPKESPEAANADIEAFFKAVRELRQQFKLTDVLLVASVNVLYPGKGEGRAMTYAHFGDSREAETMAAYVYGAEGAERREMMAHLCAGKK